MRVHTCTQALKYYERAFKINSRSKEGVMSIGHTLREMKRLEEAVHARMLYMHICTHPRTPARRHQHVYMDRLKFGV